MTIARIAALYKRQDSHSIVYAATALLCLVAGIVHVFWQPVSRQDQLMVAGITCVSAVFFVLPLAFGRSYPQFLGTLSVCIGLTGIGVTAAIADSLQLVLNSVLLLPVMALVCGWFYPIRFARTALLVTLGALIWILASRAQSFDGTILTVTTFLYCALITIFLFETGAYLHRQTLRRATHDSLTDAANRYGFSRAASTEMQRAFRSGSALTVVVMDFDDFKRVNDTGGHLAGDIVLRESVKQWRLGLRPYDIIARLGGDEFAAMLPGIDAEAAQPIVERLCVMSSHAWSWGLAEWDRSESLETLLERADAGLLQMRALRATRPE